MTDDIMNDCKTSDEIVEKGQTTGKQNQVVKVNGVTKDESSDLLEESGNFCDFSGDSSNYDDNSDVIHAFIKSTNDDVGGWL